MNKYCLPIRSATMSGVLEEIRRHNAYDFFEVWLDYIADLDEIFVGKLAQRLGGKLVVVFRRQNLEPMHMAPGRRMDILQVLDQTPVLVDLDLATQKRELDYIGSEGLKIQTIVSHHDYHKTPSDATLQGIVADMEKYKPSVYKIATMCKSKVDALLLLNLLLFLKSKKRRFIVLGMGKEGVITRVFGTLWGNELVFAPETRAKQSAPGQLTRAQMKQIMRVLEG